MPVVQDYIEFIIKRHETLPNNPPIYIYSNRINNRLVFKIKDGYKLHKIIWQHLKINRQSKEWRKCTVS